MENVKLFGIRVANPNKLVDKLNFINRVYYAGNKSISTPLNLTGLIIKNFLDIPIYIKYFLSYSTLSGLILMVYFYESGKYHKLQAHSGYKPEWACSPAKPDTHE